MGTGVGPAGVTEIASSVRQGDRTVLDVLEEALERIALGNPALNAFVALDPDRAREEAAAVDARVRAGEDPGPLAGVPVGVKDLEDAQGFVTTHGDPAYADDPPSAVDSVEVARLKSAGAVVVGKTNTPPHGVRAETDNRVFGPSRNPWATTRTPGGSSGGSGAAVAAGLVPLATGSDGGGSIRIPSAVCGLPGFKATHGVVPNADVGAPAWGPFSTRGPMARSFADIAVALDVVKGLSNRDILSVEVPGSFSDAVERRSVDGLRVAWSHTLGVADVDPRVIAACEVGIGALQDAGARVEAVGKVLDEDPLGAWGARSAPGTRHHFNQRDMAWSERFDEASLLLAGMAEFVDMDMLLDGEAGAHAVLLALADVFDRFDLLACPATLTVPPKVGEESPYGPGWAATMTMPFNLTRSPAAVVPVGLVEDDGDRLPVAIQIAGPRLSDLRVMSAAAGLEEILDPIAPRPHRVL
ncbi:MAG: amidase [Acidimicrobiia bacterium]|nr:amidase [Acidimicrobiia bacterium]